MKKLYIVANWKSNKTMSEAISWLTFFKDHPIPEGKEVIVCVPYTLLAVCTFFIHEHNLSLEVASQDVSAFPSGSYTGEVHAGHVKEFADYVLVGHSERQKHLGETREIVEQKVQQALTADLKTIVCVPDVETKIPESISMVAYEPPTSISPGIPDTPENAEIAGLKLKNEQHAPVVLYGGNVTAENVASYTSQSSIDGVLVGRASLNPEEFLRVIEHA